MAHFAELESKTDPTGFTSDTHLVVKRVVVVGNDFDESLCSYKRKQGTYCFDENFELQIIQFPGYSTIRNLARSSAFMRYVVFNLSISWRHIMSKLKIIILFIQNI